MAVREREKPRTGQDRLDELGQILSGTLYLTSNLHQQFAVESRPEAQPVGQSLRLTDEAMTQMREPARGLRPAQPEPNGLMLAAVYAAPFWFAADQQPG